MRFDGRASRKLLVFPVLVMAFVPAASVGQVPPEYAFGAGGVGAPAGGVAEQLAAATTAAPYGFCTVHIGPASCPASGGPPPDDPTVEDPPPPVPFCAAPPPHELTRRTRTRHQAKHARIMVRPS